MSNAQHGELRVPRIGPGAHARIQQRAREIRSLLDGCNRRDLELLIRYYVHGQDEQQVLESTGATAEEFARLRLLIRKKATSEYRTRSKAASAG